MSSPHSPTKLKKKPEQRKRAARRWLEGRGQTADDATVEALAPFFYPTDLEWVRAAADLLARGQAVSPAAVRAQVARARDAQWGPSWIERATAEGIDVDAEGAALAALLTAYWTAHRQGPLWSELAASRGWTRQHAELVIKASAAAGWVVFNPTTRSLAARRRGVVTSPRRGEPAVSSASTARGPVI
jgi:hypothetical protein